MCAAVSGALRFEKFIETSAAVSSGERTTFATPVEDVMTGGTSAAPLRTATKVRCATGAPSLSNSLTSACALVNPVPEARNIAVPFVKSASSAALIVTVWKDAKFPGVKVKVAPPVTVKLVSPDNRATVTVTVAGGGLANLTPNWAELFSSTARVLVRLVKICIGTSLSTSATLTSALVNPVPEARMTAVPLIISASSAALIVTFWSVAKLAGVLLSVVPIVTVKSASPDNRATFTVTVVGGALANLTPN